MIHATTYSNGSGFIEVLNCKDDAGKPVIYAKQFSSVAEMQQTTVQFEDCPEQVQQFIMQNLPD